MTRLRVHPIDPTRLQAIRDAAKDEHGNEVSAFPAGGGEPLRCCLHGALPGEAIALISYSPFTTQSPWTEVGPVFVHAERCDGYTATGELPAELRTGPRVLRTYHDDGSLDYDDITYVPAGEDIEDALRDLLDRPEVARVHVRASMSQCYMYTVTASGS